MLLRRLQIHTPGATAEARASGAVGVLATPLNANLPPHADHSAGAAVPRIRLLIDARGAALDLPGRAEPRRLPSPVAARSGVTGVDQRFSAAGAEQRDGDPPECRWLRFLHLQ